MEDLLRNKANLARSNQAVENRRTNIWRIEIAAKNAVYDTPSLVGSKICCILSKVRLSRTIKNGAMAQLVAHLHGMEGVGGSNPPSSTI